MLFRSLIDEYFLIRGMSSSMSYLLLAFSAILGVILLFVFGRVMMLLIKKQVFFMEKRVWLAAGVMMASYMFFATYFDPITNEFWLYPLISFWLLCILTGLSLKQNLGFDNQLKYGLWTVAVLLLVVNYFGSMSYIKNPNNDYYFEQVKALKSKTTDQDLVVIGRNWQIREYIYYFLDLKLVSLADIFNPKESQVNLLVLSQMINQTLSNGGRVYISPEAVEIEAATAKHFKVSKKEMATFWSTYQREMSKLKIGEAQFYVL